MYIFICDAHDRVAVSARLVPLLHFWRNPLLGYGTLSTAARACGA
jgi:hypothetical protein